jgi:SAM-dependent methyltransferase
MPLGRLESLISRIPVLSRLTDRLDALRMRPALLPIETNLLRMPDDVLQSRVVGDVSLDFLVSGQQSAENLQYILSRQGLSISSFDRILDFGCGCARTQRFLFSLGAKNKALGVDVDTAQIKYCNDWMSQLGDYIAIPNDPPMPLCESEFDFIYSISTFTHFREDYQHRWLEDLRRVSRPGGILILTIAGKRNLVYLNEMQKEELRQRGFVFVEGAARMDHNPDYYHLALHTHDYVYRIWSQYFEIIDIVPEIINDNQTAIVCRRR